MEGVTQIFSYSLTFLLGVILGAIGEMFFSGRLFKQPGSTDSAPPEGVSVITPPMDGLIPDSDLNELVPPSHENGTEQTTPSYQPAKLAVPRPAAPAKANSTKPQKILSIAEQIDEVLQEIQHYQPSDLPPVSLHEDGKQGVIVKVGNQVYPGIDAVADEAVRNLIRKAVTEWEKRTGHH